MSDPTKNEKSSHPPIGVTFYWRARRSEQPRLLGPQASVKVAQAILGGASISKPSTCL
jgi:hypothetical protein